MDRQTKIGLLNKLLENFNTFLGECKFKEAQNSINQMRKISSEELRSDIDSYVNLCESELCEAKHTRFCLNEHLKNFKTSLEVCYFGEAQDCIQRIKNITSKLFRGDIDSCIKQCESELCEAIHTRLCLNEHLKNFKTSLEVCDFEEAQDCIQRIKKITSKLFRGDIDSYIKHCESKLCEAQNRDELSILLHEIAFSFINVVGKYDCLSKNIDKYEEELSKQESNIERVNELRTLVSSHDSDNEEKIETILENFDNKKRQGLQLIAFRVMDTLATYEKPTDTLVTVEKPTEYIKLLQSLAERIGLNITDYIL